MATYKSTFTVKRLWLILAGSMVVMFGALGYFGAEIYHQAPPIPARFATADGGVVYTGAEVARGQNVWQSTGGMQQGSLWGHGSYLAPDWSADWLHREALTRLAAGIDQPALAAEMRRNTYDAATDTVTLSAARATAVAEVAAHYSRLYQASDAEALRLRKDYAFPADAVLTAEDAHALSAFFFWSAWSTVTNRPGDDISYTSNWPHEPLVGNTPTASVLMWSLGSIVLLLAGIGAIVWYYVRQYDVWRADMEPENGYATTDAMATAALTPSMRATAKYFWVVGALIVVQVLLGIVTAHYAVEGQGFYGLPLMQYLPYMPSPAPGTPSWRCCGSPPRGWPRGCMWRRCCRATSQSSRGWG